jgi:hypothetical protein
MHPVTDKPVQPHLVFTVQACEAGVVLQPSTQNLLCLLGHRRVGVQVGTSKREHSKSCCMHSASRQRTGLAKVCMKNSLVWCGRQLGVVLCAAAAAALCGWC